MYIDSARCQNNMLFQLLDAHFGVKDVQNVGQERSWLEVTPGRFRTVVHGEQYKINCPACYDTRGRALVSYLFGVPKPWDPGLNLWPWHCFNDACHEDWNNTQALWETLQQIGVPHRERRVKAYEPVDPDKVWKHPKNRLKRLGGEPAAWLRVQGFDPEQLRKTWKLGTEYFSELSTPRLYIPVYGYPNEREYLLQGWQLRTLSDADQRPKYMSAKGMARMKLVYGLAEARMAWARWGKGRRWGTNERKPLIVCEGPKDVWRLHEAKIPAVGLFGKSSNLLQVRAVAERFPTNSVQVLVMLDQDVDDEVLNNVCEQFRQEFKHVDPLVSPHGNSPADCSVKQLRKIFR